ncbi:MAG: methyltransferase [Planctomycetaceae bacterium]
MTSTDFLIIEPFLHDAIQARALQAAFELGIIDTLESNAGLTESQILRGRVCDTAGGRFLLQVLARSGVVSISGESIQLTETFRAALGFRDLLLTKLQFSELVAADFFNRMPQLLHSSEAFMETSKLFELFDYSRCFEITPQNCLQAARWMKLTTTLTRYEAPVCVEHFDFSAHHKMLDLGGNSGEFAIQVCRRAPAIQACVADLPVVCHVGTRHVAEQQMSDRIQFQPLNFTQDPIPAGYDLVTCKSVLHDWPDEYAVQILQSVYKSLPEDGCFLIFERQQWEFQTEAMPYGSLPVALFFRSYRKPEFYVTALQVAGFQGIKVQTIRLDLPFMLISATK